MPFDKGRRRPLNGRKTRQRDVFSRLSVRGLVNDDNNNNNNENNDDNNNNKNNNYEVQQQSQYYQTVLCIIVVVVVIGWYNHHRTGEDPIGFHAYRSAASMLTVIVQHVRPTTRTYGNKKAIVFSPKRHRCIVRKYNNE